MKNSIHKALVLALWASVGVASAATFTVTNTNDSGAGSLRDAVNQANANSGSDTVNFAPGVSGTIILTDQIWIAGPMSIQGPGASTLTIDANAVSRAFTIGTNSLACPALDNGGVDYLVSISGLRLINGRRSTSNVGGAIYTEHSLALDSVSIENSFAALGGGLGFMVQYPNQALTINNTLFLNNIAKPLQSLPASTHHGGAVYVSEKCASMPTTAPVTVNINASNFTNNRIQPLGLSARGGAISVISRADVTISNSRIVGNGVDAPNPLPTPLPGQAPPTYRAGALYGYGNKSVTINSSEISDNTATSAVINNQTRAGAIGLAHDDVALQTPENATVFKVIDSTISSNATTDMAGAMWLYGNIVFELYNSTISNNIAASGSIGAIAFQTGTTTPLSSNNALAPRFNAYSSIVANSSAGTVDVGINDTPNMSALSINATNSLINSVCSSCGVSIVGSGNLTGVDPVLGALAFNGASTRTHALLSGSPAINAGSNPLSLPSDQRYRPRVTNGQADMGAYEKETIFTVANTTDNAVGSLREAVYWASNSPAPNTVNLQGLSGTIALTSGPIYIKGPMSIMGPGAGSLTIDANAIVNPYDNTEKRIFAISTNFTACPEQDNGGNDYLVSISGLRLINGSTKYSGGAIYTEHSLTLDSVNIENSFASWGGGLAFMVQYPNQALTINRSIFTNNVAKPNGFVADDGMHDGGAIRILQKCAPSITEPVTVNINESGFTNNRVQPVGWSGRGGAISVRSRADVTISNSRINGNGVDAPNPLVADKTYRAGALHGYGSKSITIRNSEISNNTATSAVVNGQTRSGAIDLVQDHPAAQTPELAMKFKVINSTISGNTATDSVGAMRLYGNVAFELFNSTISNNASASNSNGSVVFQTDVTSPASASNALAPTFSAVSSIIANSLGGGVDVGIRDTSKMPILTINATKSLIESKCNTCSIVGSGNLTGVDPVLGALAFNGGSTRTHAVLAGSPAVNAGSNPLSLIYDQRGSARVQRGKADMGSYESSIKTKTDITPILMLLLD